MLLTNKCEDDKRTLDGQRRYSGAKDTESASETICNEA